jgi:D-alanyl-D-alanine carboxypeptidase
MSGFLDHLWQALQFFALACVLAWLARRNSAQIRLWLWRLTALKFVLPFSLLYALGGWFGFPVRFAGDPPPPRAVALVEQISPWFSASAWTGSATSRVVLLAALLLFALAAARWALWRIHREALAASNEAARLEVSPDDREPSMGFMRAALFTACALVVVSLPLLGGAVRASVHAHEVLEANTLTLSEGHVRILPAKSGLGSRYFVKVDSEGVTLRNITVRELTGMAYGVNRFFVRGKHFRDGADEDWLIDSRYDVQVDAPVLEPSRFDTYAMRHVITRELAQRFGLEIYVNSECQKPCGKWGDRVLLQVTPDSWALVDKQKAAASAQPATQFVRLSQPARAQFRSFLAAFNSNDREVITRFIAEQVSAEWSGRPGPDETLSLLKQTGGFEVLSLTNRGPNQLKGWVRAHDSDALMAVSFDVESEPPHRISRFVFEWGTPPPEYFPQRLSEAAAVHAIRAEAASRGASGKFSGALLVARGPSVLARGAYGLADRDANRENRIDTRFRIASVTQMFTAVAVLRLVQEGKLDLRDPIGKHVPEILGKPLARATIHQLLTHTSGAGDIDDPEYVLRRLELHTLSDYVKVLGVVRPEVPPAQRFLPSSLGYLLLGRMVETVSGRSYFDFIDDVVFKPAGMRSTGFALEESAAQIYERPAGTNTWINARYALDYRSTSPGSAYSTVDDLHRFAMALTGHQLLNSKFTELMLRPHQAVWKGNDFGYGAMRISYAWTGQWLGYASAYTGLDAQLWMSPDTGYVVIALANCDSPAARQLSDFATARLPGK